VDEYILKACGHGDEAKGDPVLAGYLNTADIVKQTQADERYHQKNNQMVPKRINSHLVVFDCVTCNKCIPVCPNDANFLYETPKVDLTYRDVFVSADGSVSEVGEAKKFTVERTQQIANYADYCNHCGNCDTFCPEYDGPYIKKPSFFGSKKAFEAGAAHDGFFVEATGESLTLHGRMDGATLRLDRLDVADDAWRFTDGAATLLIRSDGIELDPGSDRLGGGHTVDLGRFHTMRVLLAGITDANRVHHVNTPLLAASPAGK
jgi:putative selenate reductase